MTNLKPCPFCGNELLSVGWTEAVRIAMERWNERVKE